MSNSVTAAKRRRAGPLTSSPLFQAPASNKSAPSSTSNASAPTYNPNVQKTQNNTKSVQPVETPSPRGLTLQQVISQLDTRLLFLEQFVIDSKASTNLKPTTVTDSAANTPVVSQTVEPNISMPDVEIMVKQLLDEHMSEFSHRYELLATEILNLKMIVMKLQTYTLDVNKALMDERIRILSDLGDNGSQNNMDEQAEPELSQENQEADHFVEETQEEPQEHNEEIHEQCDEVQEQLTEASENNITTEIVEVSAEQTISDNYDKTANALAQMGIFLPAQN